MKLQNYVKCVAKQRLQHDTTAANSNARVSHVHISTGMVGLVLKYLLTSINKIPVCFFPSEAEKALELDVFVSLITVLTICLL